MYQDHRTKPESLRRSQILFTLVDGLIIETVVIPFKKERSRTTVCVSSQVGCAMNCQFCFTGRQDFRCSFSHYLYFGYLT